MQASIRPSPPVLIRSSRRSRKRPTSSPWCWNPPMATLYGDRGPCRPYRSRSCAPPDGPAHGNQLDNFFLHWCTEHLDPGDTTSAKATWTYRTFRCLMTSTSLPAVHGLHAAHTYGTDAAGRAGSHIRYEVFGPRISGPPRETAFEPSGEYLEWLARAPDRLPAGAARSLYDTLAYRTSFVVYRR